MALKKIHEWNTYPAGSDDGGAYDIVERGLAANKITDAFRDMAKQVGARISDLQRASVIVGTVGDQDGKLVITLPSGDTTFSNDYSFVMRFPNDISGLTDPLILRLGNTDFNVVHWVYGTNLNKADLSAGKKYICFVDKANSKIEVFNAKLDLDADAVSTSNIANDAVTADKIADNAVLSGAIADGAVLSGAIADGAVLSGAIAEDAVTADKIVDGVITGIAKIATAEITALPSTFTYQFSRTATSQSPIYLRVMGKAHISDTDREVGDAANIDFVLRINSSIVSRNYFYLLPHGDEINDWTFSREFPFFVYYRIVSGSSFQMALDVVNGGSGDRTLSPSLSTSSDNRIWVEELREVVNLT